MQSKVGLMSSQNSNLNVIQLNLSYVFLEVFGLNAVSAILTQPSSLSLLVIFQSNTADVPRC